jgi:DNA-binding response OmpR family regulator/HPt (histidine-containing phosphotransfer) domain-containing protein
VQRILVVDDDPVQVDVVSFLLRRSGLEPLVAFDAATAISAFDEREPDLVVLDIELGDADGLDLLRRFRRQRPEVPILMLTARGAENDRVRGLELGADDYLPKPFGHREFIARVRAMLRRSAVPTPAPTTPERLVVGALVLDPLTHEATLAGERLDLTPTEFRLLQSLMARPDAVVPTRNLLREVWGHQDLTARNVVRVTAGRLRAKLEDDPSNPRRLVTVPGEGLLLRSAGAIDDARSSSDGRPVTEPGPAVAGPVPPVEESGPIAPEQIAELRLLQADTGFDALRSLVEVFEKTAPTRLAAMRDALERRDGVALARQAHTLKGSSAIVGARRVVDACATIEQLSRAADLGRVPDLLAQIETELARFERAIQSVLAEGPA